MYTTLKTSNDSREKKSWSLRSTAFALIVVVLMVSVFMMATYTCRRRWSTALRAPSRVVVLDENPATGLGTPQTCSGEGVNCLNTKCCNDRNHKCFKKNFEFAACKKSCDPGKVDPEDPVEWRTEWSCDIMAAVDPAGPPTVVAPPEQVLPNIVPPTVDLPTSLPPPALPAAVVPANSGCFVVDVGKLLLVRHSYGTLDIPGGTADFGESPEATACRETFEETGYRVRADGLRKVMDDGFHIFDCHLLAPNQEAMPDPSEVAEVMWRAVLPSAPWRFPEEFELFSTWLGP